MVGLVFAEQRRSDKSVIAVLSFVACQAVAAQTAKPEQQKPSQSIEEVVVYGLRAERSSTALGLDAALKETPATVNVITRNFLDSIQPRSVEDMLQYTPGVSAGNFNGVGQEFNIRGFSANTVGDNGGQPIFIGDYRGPALRYNFDQSLFERIDFLKGTNGILYGAAPPGGIIRFVPRRPRFDGEHRIDVQVGSYDLRRLTVDSTGSRNDDQTLAYRVIATASEFNSTGHGQNDDEVFDERTILKPSLTWRTPTGGEVYVSYEYNDYENVYEPGIPVLPDGSFLFNNDPLSSSDGGIISNTHSIVTAEVTQPINDNWDLFLGGNLIDTNGTSRWNMAFRAGSTGLFRLEHRFRPSQDNDQIEGRAEIRGRFSTRGQMNHQLTVGVNHYDSAREILGQNAERTSDLIDPFNPVFPANVLEANPEFFFRVVNTVMQIYLQDYISIGEKWNFFGGISYLDGEATREDANPERGTLEDDTVDFSMGVVYNHSPLVNPFITYSTSLMPQNGNLLNGDPIPFREGEQLEIGWKGELFDGNALFTGSVFEIEQTNIAEGLPNNPGFSALVGTQRTRGLELELVGSVTDNFSVIAGYSYLDAEITDNTTGLEGNTPQDVPENKASLFGQYEFTGTLDGWSVGIGAIYVDEREGTNRNEDSRTLPSYTRFDWTVGFDKGPYTVRGTVENIFDEEYAQGSGLGQFGNIAAQGARRFLTLSLSYAFGRS